MLTVLLNAGGGEHVAGGSVQNGFRCELRLLGVRIVQEQQAHSSSGRSERSSLAMISIIQAICANRRCVFICLLKSPRLAAQPALPPVLFDYHLCCFPPLSAPQRWPLFCACVALCIQFPHVEVSQMRCAISMSVTANLCVTLCVLDFTLLSKMFRWSQRCFFW